MSQAREAESGEAANQRLKALAEIGRMVSNGLDSQAVLEAAAEAAVRLLDGDVARIWLNDPGARVLRPAAEAPSAPSAPRVVASLSVDDSLAGLALRSGEPIALHNATHHPLWHPVYTPAETPAASLFVPILHLEQSLGVLVVFNNRDREYGSDDLDLARALASHVAVSIHNARHFEETRDQARHLAAVLEVNKQLALGPRPDDVLPRITEAAARLVGVSIARLRLLQGDTLARVADFGAVPAIPDIRLLISQQFLPRILEERRQVHCGDAWSDPRLPADVRDHAKQQNIRSWLGVPLINSEGVVGTISVAAPEPHRFSAADIRILETFADQAAVAMRNALAFQREQERRSQLEVIQQVTADITRELDITALLRLILERATGLFGALYGVISRWDEPSQMLIAWAWLGLPEAISNIRQRLGEGMAGLAAQRRAGVAVEDYAASPYAIPQFRDNTTVRALMTEPILYQDRLIGTITIGRDTVSPAFSPRDQQLLGLFARQAALAIENARLFEQAASVEALRELSRLKTEFLSTMSHELRTPLSLIHGYAELLIERSARLQTGQVADMAALIQQGSATMIRMVDDLLDFSQLERGSLRLRRERVLVAQVLGEAAAAYRLKPGGARIATRLPEAVYGELDPEILKRVVGQLLANALRYAPKGPIVLSAAVNGEELVVEVSDEGPGIAQEEQERIFEKLYRGALALHSPNRGTGLGLAVVKHLVELLDGRVGVRSVPNASTVFWFTLPLIPAATAAPPAPSPVPDEAVRGPAPA